MMIAMFIIETSGFRHVLLPTQEAILADFADISCIKLHLLRSDPLGFCLLRHRGVSRHTYALELDWWEGHTVAGVEAQIIFVIGF